MDAFVLKSTLFELRPKQCGHTYVRGKAISKLSTIASLNTLHLELESLQHIIQKSSIRVSADLFEASHITKTRPFIDCSILVKHLASICLGDNTGGWNIFLHQFVHAVLGTASSHMAIVFFDRLRQQDIAKTRSNNNDRF